MQLPDPQQWNFERLSNLKITPWSNFKVDDPEARFREYDRVDKSVPEDAVAKARRVYIRQKDLEDFGYTDGCKRCDHTIAYGPNKTSVPHTEACRRRLMDEMSKTPAGQARLAQMTERENQFLENRFEKGDFAQGEKHENVDIEDGRAPPSFQRFVALDPADVLVAPVRPQGKNSGDSGGETHSNSQGKNSRDSGGEFTAIHLE